VSQSTEEVLTELSRAKTYIIR